MGGVSGRLRITPDGRLTTGRLAGLTMGRAMWVLCWPVLLESYLNWLVGVVDTKLSARLSVEAADAVGPASAFMWFIGLIGMAIGVGATAVVSRCVGRGRVAAANAAVGQTLMLAVSLGAVVGVVLAFAAGPIGHLVSLQGETHRLFRDYLFVVALGVPASSMLMAGISCIRGAGDSIRPLGVMFLVNAVNIAVSWALSGVPLGFGGSELSSPFGFDLGIVGIGLGTIVGHGVGALAVLAILVRGRSGVRLLRRRLAFDRVTTWRILRIGVPNFMESLGMWLGNFVVVLFVGWLHAASASAGVFGAHIIAIRVEAISFLPGFAMGMATATLVGQYLGAGSPELARRAIVRATLFAMLIMNLMGLAFMQAPVWITGLFSPEPIHAELVPPLLQICALIQIPFAVSMVIRSALRGAGDVRVVLCLTLISTYLLRIPMAYLLSGVDMVRLVEGPDGGMVPEVIFENPSPLDLGLPGLWIGLCGEIALRWLLFLGRFLQGGWRRVRV